MNKKRVLTKIILVLAMVITLAPVLFMIFGSFKTNISLALIPPDLSLESTTLANWQQVLTGKGAKAFVNSVFIAVVTTFLAITFTSMAGYAFARKNFLGKDFAFGTLMATLMIPSQILMVPTFILMVKMGLYDSKLAVILSTAAPASGVFLMKQAMSTLPMEIFESAEMDGCSEFGQYFRMALPLAKSPIAALSIFTFVGSWNNFIWQLILLTSEEHVTITLFLRSMVRAQDNLPIYGYQFAGAALASVPIIIAFLIFSKHFVSGITVGAVKG